MSGVHLPTLLLALVINIAFVVLIVYGMKHFGLID